MPHISFSKANNLVVFCLNYIHWNIEECGKRLRAEYVNCYVISSSF